MTALTASVIVVSRHRTEALHLCLTSLRQQDFSAFEVIVVADPQAISQTADFLGAARSGFILHAFDEANISKARNIGLTRAAGDIVAFIDDDAVAEPTWLSRLVSAFENPAIVAATGFVRGRNGISYQWQASEVDAEAEDHPIAVTTPTILSGTRQRAVKTQGTNCAFRRKELLGIGGFDPAIHFYLDEADVNLRLAERGATAILPDAEVQHGFAASARRTANRVPLSLHEIAASTAVFLRRHTAGADPEQMWSRLEHREEARIQQHLAAGQLSAEAAADLRAGLARGWKEGLTRTLPDLTPLQPLAPGALVAIPNTGWKPGLVIAGRIWRKTRLLARARQAVRDGKIVTVLCLSPTMRAHRVIFHPDGFWLQTGGLFGRSRRDAPRFRLIGFSQRIAEEINRIGRVRPMR